MAGPVLAGCLCACGRVGFGAPDGAGVEAAADGDGDGVADASDNCPATPNPDQANEDGDAFGDRCDPCPPFADDVPVVDADRDGVSDPCDPFPAIAGDEILVFDGLGAAPAGAEIVGAWTFDGDRATVTSALSVISAITWIVPIGIRTVSAHATALEYFGDNVARPIGVVTEFDAAAPDGTTCVFGINPSNDQVMAIADIKTLAALTITPAVAAVGSSTTFFLTKQQDAHSCLGSAITSAISANSDLEVAPHRTGIFTRSASASFDWAMVISSR